MLLSIHAWQARNDDAWAADQHALNEWLLVLKSNQQQLVETLSKFMKQTSHPLFLLTAWGADMQHNNVMAMMVLLQRCLDHLPDDD